MKPSLVFLELLLAVAVIVAGLLCVAFGAIVAATPDDPFGARLGGVALVVGGLVFMGAGAAMVWMVRRGRRKER
ncbi:MAG: hypothetical protein HYX97_02875 [Chloroflexi bacterium]|nr:hypothetical protein [Chloroflexota bacterium]